MSIQPSLLKCPQCTDQTLETVTTALGSVERCPRCLSLWIEQKLVAAYSDDKVVCREALAETKSLLLPTERWCPRCFQKMVDGRVRTRRVVLHLCVTCEALWTDWETLAKFDEFIERALRAQVESASLAPQTPLTPSPNQTPVQPAGWPQIEDTGMGKMLRSLARTLDTMADGVGGASAYRPPKPQAPKPAKKTPPPAKPASPKITKEAPKEKGRKILRADELPPEPIIVSQGSSIEEPPVEMAPPVQGPSQVIVPDVASAPETPPPVVPEVASAPEPVAIASGPLLVSEADAPPLSETPKVVERLPDLVSISEAVEMPALSATPSAPVEPVPDGPFSAADLIPLAPELKALPFEEKSPAIPPSIEVEIPEAVPDVEPATPPQPIPSAVEILPPKLIEPEQAFQAEPAPTPEPVTPAAEEPNLSGAASGAISHLLGGAWEEEEETPKKKSPPAPKPTVARSPKPTAPVANPMFSKAKEKGPGFLSKWAAKLKPKQKPPISAPTSGPVSLPKPAPTPSLEPSLAPISQTPEMPMPKPIVLPPKKATPAPIVSRKENLPKPAPTLEKDATKKPRLWGMFKAKPKPPKVAELPTPAPVEAPLEPMASSPAPAAAVAPSVRPEISEVVIPPMAPVKPVSKPAMPTVKLKPPRPKTKKSAQTIALRLLPWALAVFAFGINYARGYDFELSFALLWSACAWAVGTLMRLAFLYPFKEFAEMSLAAVLEYPGLNAAKGLPVLLNGILEPENPLIPKGPLVFRQEGQTLALNKVGTFDLIPRLFGLGNPGQLVPGEATLLGWYRRAEPAYLEIGVVTLGKKRRASSVRALRWAGAVFILVIAGLVLMTAE